MTRTFWFLKQLATQLWLRASMFSIVGIIAALLAYFFKDNLPASLDAHIGADAVSTLLTILASSMLAVTTFSLGIMVSAFTSAASAATPRTTQLLRADPVSQTVLSVFIGAFLFSIVGIIALQAGVYGVTGRPILFVLSIAVTLVVVIALLRWIDHLSHFGLLMDTIDLVEVAAANSISTRLDRPWLGGSPRPDEIPLDVSRPIYVPDIGYIQNIDIASLAQFAEETQSSLYLNVIPGRFNDSVQPVAHIIGDVADDKLADLADAFQIGRERTFEQDPRFGCVVLSEIASRALSPAVNDPGTAIGIIKRGITILAPWMSSQNQPDANPDVRYTRVFVPGLSTMELLDDLFTPIARDGAAIIEVQIALQKAFHSLAALGGNACAPLLQDHAQQAMRRAMAALTSEDDRKRLSLHIYTRHLPD